MQFKKKFVEINICTCLFAVLIVYCGCNSARVKLPNSIMTKFEAFKAKEKFTEDRALFYPGLADQSLRMLLSKKINEAADDFEALAAKGNVTEKEYQDQIKSSLSEFEDVYENLDTEERERICSYFEELMDIVGVKSSGGHLNNFMYGFDPS